MIDSQGCGHDFDHPPLLNMSFTGHRKIEPEDVESVEWSLGTLNSILYNQRYIYVLHTGGAAGFDTLVLKSTWPHIDAIHHLHVPYDYQLKALLKELGVTQEYLEMDAEICRKCGPHPYTGDKSYYQPRNEHMVDQLTGPKDVLITYYNGGPSGTKNCIDYARGLPKPPRIIDIRDIKSESDIA